MESISLGFILSATGGRLARESYNIKVTGVCTDTRAIAPGCLFIALRGERFDGHDYIEAAFAKGARAAVSEKPVEDAHGPVIVVRDTRAALLHLAQAYRLLFGLPIAAVTGSVGKTSTKETVYAVLSRRFKTLKNEGNHNNEIGMPMSVFGLDRTFGAAVFEMGMSGFGEISRLSRVAQPDIGVITNIGVSHIGKLGSRENILKAKLELLDGMKQGGDLVLNGDNDLLWDYIGQARGRLPIEITVYGVTSRDGVYAENIEENETGSSFDIRFAGGSVRARMPVPGRHNVFNALAAFCVGQKLGISPQEAVEGLAAYRPSGMRQKVERVRGVAFVEDCYNASPDSMKAAFDVLNTIRRGRVIAVLGDMLELGDASQGAHMQVGRDAAGVADILLTTGDDARYCCEGFREAASPGAECCFFEDRQALANALLGLLREGDTVLFKASRGLKMEEIYETVRAGWSR